MKDVVKVGDLYITLEGGTILAFSNDEPYRSEFRMKPGYIFTVIETDINVGKVYDYVRVIMSNTGKFQLVDLDELVAYLSRNFVKKIG